MQAIIKCAQSSCRKFFVDTPEERQKARNNGWSIAVKNMNVCGNHRYRLFAEVGE